MSAESRPRAGGQVVTLPVDALFAIALFVVAFALRLLVARALAGEPVWDGHYYDFGARHIASGFGYADEVTRDGHLVWHPWCHYPVGYSGFLAAFYKMFGASHGVAHFANALVGGSADIATGSALYKRINRKPGIVIANIGDASLGCGPVWEAMNFFKGEFAAVERADDGATAFSAKIES